MRYSFHPEAELEFFEAIEYYEGCESGLGYDFALEVYTTVERIRANPKAIYDRGYSKGIGKKISIWNFIFRR